ncbi:hypothetical protein HZB07_05525 [Candidatus Saganbacteria bacterium]|nr:hypothetical protein [Candidatus Saganbacteria bacterium]
MNYFAFSALINGLTSLLLGLYVLRKGVQKPLNLNYIFFAFSVFFWSYGYFFWQISTLPEIALFYCRLLMAGAALIPVAYFNFSLWLTNTYEKKRWESRLSFFIGLIFMLLAGTPLIVSSVTSKMFFSFWPEPGPIYPLFLLMFFYYTIYSLTIMYRVYKKSPEYLKAQISYVFWGTGIGFLAGSTNFLLWYNIPVPPLPNILVSIYPLLLSFAITKHHLMDISIVISRAVAEIMVVLFHTAVYFALVWLHINFVSDKIGWLFFGGTVFYGIIVGQTHLGLRLFFQTTSNKLFLRGKYDYYKVLSEASVKVTGKLSMPFILGTLYDVFRNAVEISQPKIFLPEYFSEPEKKSQRYIIFNEKGAPLSPMAEAIGINETLVDNLINRREVIFDSASQSARLIVPCLLEERLIAIFIFGPKLSEDPYTTEDLRLFKILASQAALALDHARSYEKIKADLAAAERQLTRSERLASLGILTAGITHEIRNPLAVIRSETEQLTNQERPPAELKRYRDLVLKHVDRIAAIMQRMLAMAKEKPRQVAKIDLLKSLNAVLPLIRFKNIRVIKKLNPLPGIEGDPIGIEEIFVNLIQNAIQSMPEGGTLTLSSYVEKEKPIIEISDTGKGISLENQEKIFDPFFSTRHEGTGLGLSIAYRIIREHGADIKVISEVGRGTTFKIIF